MRGNRCAFCFPRKTYIFGERREKAVRHGRQAKGDFISFAAGMPCASSRCRGGILDDQREVLTFIFSNFRFTFLSHSTICFGRARCGGEKGNKRNTKTPKKKPKVKEAKLSSLLRSPPYTPRAGCAALGEVRTGGLTSHYSNFTTVSCYTISPLCNKDLNSKQNTTQQ